MRKLKQSKTKSSKTKAQHNLDKGIAKIYALSSRKVSKYEFLTGKYVLPEKDLLEKAAAIKRFEYSPFAKELKKQTRVAKKQYQKLDQTFESNKTLEEKTKNKRSRANSNLAYNNDFTFYIYRDSKEFGTKRFIDSKQNYLKSLKNILELFYRDIVEIMPNNEEKQKKKDLC